MGRVALDYSDMLRHKMPDASADLRMLAEKVRKRARWSH